VASLVFDAALRHFNCGAGNLYGTTWVGGGGLHRDGPGPAGCGTVFKLMLDSGGHWRAITLRYFEGSDGGEPFGGLILDQAGSLYGSASVGGGTNNVCVPCGCDVAFKITP
jgi:hypothetical protein